MILLKVCGNKFLCIFTKRNNIVEKVEKECLLHDKIMGLCHIGTVKVPEKVEYDLRCPYIENRFPINICKHTEFCDMQRDVVERIQEAKRYLRLV